MASQPELIIRGHQVVLPDDIAPASIHIHNGKILRVGPYDDIPPGIDLIDARTDLVVMPGLVDTHVHVNEPGRTEWEGFRTATRAAAAGGVTTLIDMPLNSIPATTTLNALKEKQDAARGQCSVDVGFWGGVVPGNTPQLEPLASAGVVGFKCFLIHSGVDEFPNVTEEDLRKAMPELTRLNALLIVHAELPGPIERLELASCGHQPNAAATELFATRYQTFLDSRPRAAENEAVELMIRLGREFGTRVHIVHHSSADALPMIARAKASGLQLTAETCPHYLAFAAEEIPDGATEFKCCPPVRERENQEQLWSALQDGTIDMIVSDHSPCRPELKLRGTGDFLQAWGGISSLQLRLAIVWTEARKRGFSLRQLAEWLCRAPARLVGLDQQKGSIVAGADADIVIWNADEEFTVAPEMLHHRHKLTPYTGRRLQGVVHSTFLRGKKIYDGGQIKGDPAGLFLTRRNN
ncbi:MAG TPA: allantoinase AllB [Pyrinomonadaceae bacterium]|nr:allantoinase AllB [Pyrinomonadaceae bacterium]